MTTLIQRPAMFAVMAVVLATLGCDSTQPEEVTFQTVTLSFSANANVEVNDCYELFNDLDGNGTPDQDEGSVCFPLAGIESRRVPWNYSILITKVPAGSTEQQLVATSLIPGDSIPDFVSLTGYDPIIQTAPARPPDGNLSYVPIGRVTRGSQIWLESTFKDTPEGLSTIAYFLGPPNVIGQPTFTVDLATGDTVIVSARKQSLGDGPQYFTQPPGLDQNPELSINASLTAGGTPVQITGNSFSTTDDGSGFTFSYTRQ